VSAWRPGCGAERWLAVAARLGLRRDTPLLVEQTQGWRTVGALTRYAFFALGVAASGLTAGIFVLLEAPHPALLCALVVLLAAEWLIVRQRLFACGIEEALHLGGLLALAFELQRAFDGSPRTGALLVAGAFAIAGGRLLNPLCTTLAAIAAAFALAPDGALRSGDPAAAALLPPGLLCFATAVAALIVAGHRFERPAHDRMVQQLIVVMPVAGYAWLAAGQWSAAGFDYRHAHGLQAWLAPLLPLGFALAAFGVGLLRRAHAPLVAAMACAACVAFELRRLSGWSTEVRMLVWGGTLLVAAIAVDRALRSPRRGITSQRMSDRRGAISLLELAGAASLTPAAPAPPQPGLRPGGGEFGGGGASGGY
jgi:uncharacterized membrane protein YgcG